MAGSNTTAALRRDQAKPVACIGPRRFPPPWSVEELDACFVVRDHNGPAARLRSPRPVLGGGLLMRKI